jgi:glycine dehydrogenase subunit 1
VNADVPLEGHPYIPNSTPAIRERMLREVGASDPDELYAVIPERLRFRGRLDLPNGIRGEHELRALVERLLQRNRHTGEVLSFLGGGCSRHFIPAVCDEIASRGEFLTAYHDGSNSMLGSYQAQFEFQSMMGSLTGLDMVSTTTYDWGAAVASSLMMACRITGRTEVIVPSLMSPIRRRQIDAIAGQTLTIEDAPFDPATGGLDVDRLEGLVSTATGAVYLEVPAYLGTLDGHVAEIGEIAHRAGAQFVVGADPISLGILAPPARYGADIVCGDIQPLGVHMYLGGGLAGFIATPHDPAYIRECPTLLVSILETQEPGEFAFGWWNFGSTSYASRGDADDFAGTTQTIWAIVAATYLSTMGPQGMRDVGEAILARSRYALDRLASVPGLTAPVFAQSTHFKEFPIRLERDDLTVKQALDGLRDRGIYGGIDLSASLPSLGKTALVCVTEIHSEEDIDRLVSAFGEVIR